MTQAANKIRQIERHFLGKHLENSELKVDTNTYIMYLVLRARLIKNGSARDFVRIMDVFNMLYRGKIFYYDLIHDFSDLYFVIPGMFENHEHFGSLMGQVFDFMFDMHEKCRKLKSELIIAFSAYVPWSKKNKIEVLRMKPKDAYRNYLASLSSIRSYIAFYCLGMAPNFCNEIEREVSKKYFWGQYLHNIPAMASMAKIGKINDFSELAAKIAEEKRDMTLKQKVEMFCKLLYTDESVVNIIGIVD
jgi:hypothetical protein